MTGTIFTSFLSSCNDIYDDPEPYIPIPTEGFTYQYVNATSYTNWIYFNLHQKDSITLDYQSTNLPEHWDIAIHRYDIKTNNGAGLETPYESLEALQEAAENGSFAKPTENTMIPDINDSITVDMSHMMDGYLIYAASPINTEIGKWLNVDTSEMPPIYTPSNKVYLILLSDKTFAAIRFTGYANPHLYNTKGYISFDYLYPINFK